MSKSDSIEKYILDKIRAGRWQVGERLPAEPELCRELNVSQTTLRIALKTLANRGIIERRQRQGSFIARKVKANKILLLANFEKMSSAVGYFYRTVTDLLQKKLRNSGWEPELCVAGGISYTDFASNLDIENRINLDEVAGAIVTLAVAPKLREVFDRRHIPVVEITSTGLNWEYAQKPGNNIFNNTLGILQGGLDVLADCGIREFAILANADTGGNEGLSHKDYNFLREELLRRNLTVAAQNILIVPWEWDRLAAYDVFREWWSRPKRPKAIFCMEDALCKVMMRAVWELGIKVPEELAILTHGNGEFIHSPVPLATMSLDLDDIAEAACRMLSQLQQGKRASTPTLIQPTYIPGKSLNSTIPVAFTPEPAKLEIVERLCQRSLPPEADAGCWKTCAGYRFAQGQEMFEVHSDVMGRDRYDNFFDQFSDDNGQTFGHPRVIFKQMETAGRVYRTSELLQDLDTNTNSIFRFFLRGIYDNDNNDHSGIESFHRTVRLYCARSFNGGVDFSEPEDLTQIFCDFYGERRRPLISCSQLLSCSDGAIRVPCFIETQNRLNSFQCKLLIGRPAPNCRMNWSWGGDFSFSGAPAELNLNEYSIAEVGDGRLMALCRSDMIPGIPWQCRKYLLFSRDNGMSWSEAQPLRYTDGGIFYSPNSCGRLLRHSSGKLFYIANILDEDQTPQGSRQTLSIVEIDDRSLAAKRETRTLIDGIQPGDSPELAISNFTCFENRENREIVVLAPKAFQHRLDIRDCVLMRYRIQVNK